MLEWDHGEGRPRRGGQGSTTGAQKPRRNGLQNRCNPNVLAGSFRRGGGWFSPAIPVRATSACERSAIVSPDLGSSREGRVLRTIIRLLAAKYHVDGRDELWSGRILHDEPGSACAEDLGCQLGVGIHGQRCPDEAILDSGPVEVGPPGGQRGPPPTNRTVVALRREPRGRWASVALCLSSTSSVARSIASRARALSLRAPLVFR